MIRPTLFYLFCILVSGVQGQISLTVPMEGEMPRDYVIVNHVDQDTTNAYLDWSCGSKSYNGHYGTDFVLKNFIQMDSGVYILAAADGVVFQTLDGEFDRQKESIVANGFGNWIGIRHNVNGNTFYTYYAHLKTGSLLVDSGDVVSAGQRIALVGSSGNSTDPHLHFEIWNDSLVLDPWDGPCQFTPNGYLWDENIAYDTTFSVLDHGVFESDFYPDLDTIREPVFPHHTISGQQIAYADTNDYKSLRTEYVLCKGIRIGDVISSYWLSEDNDTLARLSYTAERDFWYFFYWTTLDLSLLQDSESAATETVFLKNGVTFFRVKHERNTLNTSISKPSISKPNFVRTPEGIRLLMKHTNSLQISIHNSLGQQIPFETITEQYYVELKPIPVQPQWLFLTAVDGLNVYQYKWHTMP
jgi:hypothetical protein